MKFHIDDVNIRICDVKKTVAIGIFTLHVKIHMKIHINDVKKM